MATATVCIQDKNGKHYNTLCGADYTAPEIRNMQRHLDSAHKNPKAYHFLDLTTAIIMVDGVAPGLSEEDDALLASLGE